jgi:hypothetical protein
VRRLPGLQGLRLLSLVDRARVLVYSGVASLFLRLLLELVEGLLLDLRRLDLELQLREPDLLLFELFLETGLKLLFRLDDIFLGLNMYIRPGLGKMCMKLQC